MKIVHVCLSDLEGGAAKAAYRVHKAQLQAGLDSNMLVLYKKSSCSKVKQLPYYFHFKIKIKNFLSNKILRLQSTENTVHHSLSILPSGVSSFINSMNPDIVNLHWINFEMLSIQEIPKIKSSIFWTLHDMWPFRGCEHYCIPNLALNSVYDKSNGLPLNKICYQKKLKYFRKVNISYICPSQWMAQEFEKTEFFKEKNFSIIPNCVGDQIYLAKNKQDAKGKLDLPADKKIILFGAMSSNSDPRKGYKFLKRALELLSEDTQKCLESLIIVTFGGKSNESNIAGIPLYELGCFSCDEKISNLYSAADVFVAPSIQDNLPNTVNEALFCHTPVVAFDIGGMSDMIDNENGILVQPFCEEQLKDAIYNALNRNDWNFSSNKRRYDKAVSEMYHEYYLTKYESEKTNYQEQHRTYEASIVAED